MTEPTERAWKAGFAYGIGLYSSQPLPSAEEDGWKRYAGSSAPQALIERLTKPIIGLENRSALEVFDMMVDRIRGSFRPQARSHDGPVVTDEEVERLLCRLNWEFQGDLNTSESAIGYAIRAVEMALYKERTT